MDENKKQEPTMEQFLRQEMERELGRLSAKVIELETFNQVLVTRNKKLEKKGE